MFRTALLLMFLLSAVVSTAWGQTSAPAFKPRANPVQLDSAGISTLETDSTAQLTPPADVWNAQDPRQLLPTQAFDAPQSFAPAQSFAPNQSFAPPQSFDGSQSYFAPAQPNSAIPPAFGTQPYSSTMDSNRSRCCDPVGEYVRRILGLDHEPVYLLGYYDPFSTQFAYGAAGFTPYQMGWYNKQEIAYVPFEPTHGVAGKFQFTELNGWTRYSFRVDDLHIFTWTLITNSRMLSGPSGVALGADVNLIQSDFQFASNDPGPWNWQIGVTPQVNSDFRRQLTSDAYMVDARAVLFNKISPHLTLAFGAAYWDRNHGHLIPYGGVIWAPDDRWEFRAMFPKSRVSYFAGSISNFDVWLYGSFEYTLDAYQVALEDSSRIKERLELQDYRFMLGINAIRPRIGGYLEGGYITDRHANFRGPTQDFGIGDTWTVRAGVTF